MLSHSHIHKIGNRKREHGKQHIEHVINKITKAMKLKNNVGRKHCHNAVQTESQH